MIGFVFANFEDELFINGAPPCGLGNRKKYKKLIWESTLYVFEIRSKPGF